MNNKETVVEDAIPPARSSKIAGTPRKKIPASVIRLSETTGRLLLLLSRANAHAPEPVIASIRPDRCNVESSVVAGGMSHPSDVIRQSKANPLQTAALCRVDELLVIDKRRPRRAAWPFFPVPSGFSDCRHAVRLHRDRGVHDDGVHHDAVPGPALVPGAAGRRQDLVDRLRERRRD